MKYLSFIIYQLPFKNSKSYIVNRKSQSGFTLVEVLVVLMVLLSVGSIIGSILFSSLRGASKTNTLSAVRQNGNYAITQMSKIIRNTYKYDGLSADGISYTPDCQVLTPPTPTPSPAILKYNYLKITTADNTPVVFACVFPAGDILQDGNSLVTKNAVSVTACSFSCTKNKIGDTPTINIELTLSQAGAGAFAENSAKVSFDTSIAIRNPQR